ncbi:MAG: hypothetical protein M1828_002035 [Chrysothrix sp. TS-e1954]|nr:MAG: hypothetical protein M1828_002035 [Chrysothrix sp. TS-e1954]
MARIRPGPDWASLPSFTFLLALLCLFINPAIMVKHENFKTCEQSGFCTRNRAYADNATAQASTFASPYVLDASSVKLSSSGVLTGMVRKTVKTPVNEGPKGKEDTKVRLPLTITFLESGAARVRMDEEKRQKGEIELRHNSPARKERCDVAKDWALVGGLEPSTSATINQEVKDEGVTHVQYGKVDELEAVITHKPFGIDFRRDGKTHVRFNERGFLNVEHWRPKIDRPALDENASEEQKQAEEKRKAEEEDESTWWEETFGGNTDSKPRGPESVGLDISFPGYEHVYGIPEHTGPMSLKETRGGDGNYDQPYRLYNSDVFEYEMDNPMTLYGAIPFMQAHRPGSTVGVFWLNAAETWIDIVKSRISSNPLSFTSSTGNTDTKTHWFSESGLLDVFVFLGPSPEALSQTYAELTGFTQLPNFFSLGYHQCRWNYVTDEDVKDVDRRFDRHHIPYDVIWLDIEYLDDRKYFTWDPMTFPDPIGMQKQLDEHGRHLVVIVDPHIKRVDGYKVVEELVAKDLAVKTKEAEKPWEGWCWPGASYWVDCFNPASITWMKSLFRYENFAGTTKTVQLWNDMNEPSVFNGPETTMPKDLMFHGNWEHRDIHNVNSMTFVNATFHALETRDDPKGKTPTIRPFVLTRAFFAGSQRLGAMWTGDNQASWPHLAASIPMILQNGIAGFPFAGADVGGFFGNPEKDLLTRWYQAGAFYPFFRAHAHIDTRRREPYLVGDPWQTIITQALRLRYALLPAWYTAFHTASTHGYPIVRPMWWAHPMDYHGFTLDSQMYLGDTGILVRPVVDPDASSVDIYLPAEESRIAVPYYDYFTYKLYFSYGRASQGGFVTVPAPLDTIPVLMRAGKIFPRKDRPRRSSTLMKWDPYTLVMVLDGNDPAGPADGELYVDDGETYDYRTGASIHRRFGFEDGILSSTPFASSSPSSQNATEKRKPSREESTYLASMRSVSVEKIIIVGAPGSWKDKSQVTVRVGAETRMADLQFHDRSRENAAWALVRKPDVPIGVEWSVEF